MSARAPGMASRAASATRINFIDLGHLKVLPSLVEPAALTRKCRACDKTCCAREDGTVLWHEQIGRDGRSYECAGVGLIGKRIKPEE